MRASELLGPLLDEMVLIGGCAVDLLITDDAAPPVRITRDIDVIIEAASYNEFQAIERRLRERGFSQDMSLPGPICRFHHDSLFLDVMPCDETVLGFGSCWFSRAFANSLVCRLPNGLDIRYVSAPYFLATKLIAFKTRGAGDLFRSKDFEDIVALIDGRPELPEEVAGENAELRCFIRDEFQDLMAMGDFVDCLPGMIPAADATSRRLQVILGRCESLRAETP